MDPTEQLNGHLPTFKDVKIVQLPNGTFEYWLTRTDDSLKIQSPYAYPDLLQTAKALTAFLERFE